MSMLKNDQITDKPIQTFDADVLGRARFISAVSGEIEKWNGDTSLVIGLHGRWGEGKTSVVNLLVPDVENKGLRVLRFNAWEWSSTDDLTDAFFDEISVQLGRSSRKDGAELAKAIRRYAARLKGGATGIAFLVPIVKAVLIFCALLCFADLLKPLIWLRLAAAISMGIAATVLGVSKILPMFAEAISPSGKDDLPSLEALKSKLTEELTKSKQRMLIIIDDIDRLTPDQLSDVARLVKANGDLPRVCYLLVGDRRVLAEHLSISLKLDGAEYLSKIIQLSFDLPAVEQSKLNEAFFSGLNDILDGVPGEFERDRWGRVFWSGLVGSLWNLRNIKRLLASLRVSFALTSGERALEVNKVDLIAIEVIRMFEPNLHRAIRLNKSILTEGYSDKKDSDSKAEEFLTGLLRDIIPERQRQWGQLVRLLFPYMDAGRMISYGPHNLRSWAAAQRICSPPYFDRYFRFGVGDEEVSTSDLQALFEPGSREKFVKLLEEFASRKKLPEVIARLRERADSVPHDLVEPLILAIFDTGDSLSPRSGQMYGTSSALQAEFAIQDLLKRIPDDEAKSALDRLFRQSKGIRMPIEILRNFLGREQEKRLEPFLSNDDLEEWKELFAVRIAKLASSGVLLSTEGAGLYLHLWKMWGDPDEAKKFVAEVCESREGTLSFLRAITQVAHSSNLNKRGESARPYIRHTDVSDFIDPDLLNDIIGANEPYDLKLLRLTHPEFRHFEKALKRLKEGKSDDGFGMWRDDDDDE